MSFPTIRHCLIAEDARDERRRLVTLLGLYGIAPEVTILVRDFSLPVQRLAFVLVGTPGSGNFRVSFRIVDSNNTPIHPPLAELQMPMAAEATFRNTNLLLNVGGLRFPQAGRFRFVLIVDGADYYTTDFEVSQGQPEDFE